MKKIIIKISIITLSIFLSLGLFFSCNINVKAEDNYFQYNYGVYYDGEESMSSFWLPSTMYVGTTYAVKQVGSQDRGASVTFSSNGASLSYTLNGEKSTSITILVNEAKENVFYFTPLVTGTYTTITKDLFNTNYDERWNGSTFNVLAERTNINISTTSSIWNINEAETFTISSALTGTYTVTDIGGYNTLSLDNITYSNNISISGVTTFYFKPATEEINSEININTILQLPTSDSSYTINYNIGSTSNTIITIQQPPTLLDRIIEAVGDLIEGATSWIISAFIGLVGVFWNGTELTGIGSVLLIMFGFFLVWWATLIIIRLFKVRR